jgi:hypothetical protein
MSDSKWNRIDSALSSELEDFDRFMTGREISGENAETLPDKEVEKVLSVLEKPLPERIVQEKLLENHISRRE